ncbi:DUF433 domain-containing protein [Phormidium yuhuli AB48]|uniref:DUF433 domain-containing protein n=1 Tax=Phormidium yuhuli AB48 TaxID=2940671 RepID=A0ABY5AQ99_9CYAN|nr:DUF433 domain-containing protein [Phormidium yuhuli AB48]
MLDLFAAGLTAGEILEEMPDLEPDDLKASLLYASGKLNHPATKSWSWCVAAASTLSS